MQSKPSIKAQVETTRQNPPLPNECDISERRRPHALLLSPMSSPNKEARSPVPKRFHGRPRTGQEFKSNDIVSTPPSESHVYCFQNSLKHTTTATQSPTIDVFRSSLNEKQSMKSFTTHSTSYFLLKNELTNNSLDKQLVGIHQLAKIYQALKKHPLPTLKC